MTTEAENYDNILNYSCFQFFFEKIKMAAVAVVAVVAVKTTESILCFFSLKRP